MEGIPTLTIADGDHAVISDADTGLVIAEHDLVHVCDQLFVGRLSNNSRPSQRLVSCQKSTGNRPPHRTPAFHPSAAVAGVFIPEDTITLTPGGRAHAPSTAVT